MCVWPVGNHGPFTFYPPYFPKHPRAPIQIAGETVKNRTWLLYRHASADAGVTHPFVEMFEDGPH
ncbi:MAG: hypothetical protein ACRC0C_05040 [Gibbsiella quercinecans]|uniref:hypothetical protein n=1 Tax=Gibbsiella quercinecans TaxID=929813 RepID=UPI003F303B41